MIIITSIIMIIIDCWLWVHWHDEDWENCVYGCCCCWSVTLQPTGIITIKLVIVIIAFFFYHLSFSSLTLILAKDLASRISKSLNQCCPNRLSKDNQRWESTIMGLYFYEISPNTVHSEQHQIWNWNLVAWKDLQCWHFMFPRLNALAHNGKLKEPVLCTLAKLQHVN